MFPFPIRRRLAIPVLAALAVLGSSAALAADPPYPTRPVRLLIPFAPGGGADSLARIITPKFHDLLGQAWVVDNRGGEFSTLAQGWPEREIILSEYLAELLSLGTRLHVVTNEHRTNEAFVTALRRRASARGSEPHLGLSSPDGLVTEEEARLHRKRFVTEHFVIWGSMNFTNSGIERNAEDLILDLDPAAVGRAINEMEQLHGAGSV